MSVQRPVPAPDLYNRPATVTYGAQNVPQTGYAPPPSQQHVTQQWVQQAPQQPAGPSYNPNSYPPMPGAQDQRMTQGHQQQHSSYEQSMSAQASAPQQYHSVEQHQQHQHQQHQMHQHQQPQLQHRWSAAGQLPTQGGMQTYQQQPVPQSQFIGAATVQQAGNYVQTQAPPPPPPKDMTYTQQHYQQVQQPVQYQQPPASGPTQPYQYAARPSNMQPQTAQYAVGSSQPTAGYVHAAGNAPAPTQSPQQPLSMSHAQQGQSYAQQPQQAQVYTPYQPPTQSPPVSQPWSQGGVHASQQSQHNSTPPVQQQQQQQQQQNHQRYQHQSHVSSAAPAATPMKHNEPVSPITGSRQNTAQQQVSRPNSDHIPSRSNSNSMSHSQYPTRQESSPISALKTASTAFAPKRKTMDPNGVGSTGSTALGLGGPSDWENFGPTDFEVDDLDYYSGKQEPKGVTKVKEGKSDGEPIELPAGSPNDEHAGAVEIDSGSPIATRPLLQSNTIQDPQATLSYQNLAQHPQTQQSAVTPATSQHNGQSAVYQSAIAASSPPQPHAIQPQAHEQSSDPNAGWRPSPQISQSPAMPLQQQMQPPQMQSHPSVIIGANTSTAARPSSQGSWNVSHQSPESTNMSAQAPPGAQPGFFVSSLSPRSSASSEDALRALQRKLQQTESELAQFKDREMESRLDGDKNSERIQVLQNKVSRLEDECRVAQNECSRLENSIEAMETASITIAKEKSSVEMQHNTLLSEKAAWSAERSDLAAKIGEAEVTMSKLKAEKSIWNTEKTSLSTKLGESQASLVSFAAERAAWDTERTGLNARISSGEAILAQTKNEADGTREGLIAKLAAAEMAHTTFRNDAEATSTGYQAKLKEAEQSASQMKADIDVLKKQMEDLKSQPVDIAPGLGDWYKGSLARFAETLYSEEAAATVPEKMRKFQDWVNSEAQLRGIEMQFQPKKDPNSGKDESPASKGLESTNKGEHAANTVPFKIHTDTSNQSTEEDDIQYSPGGRPIIQRKITDNKSISEVSVTLRGATPPAPISQSDQKTFRAYRADSITSKVQEPRANSVPNAITPKIDSVPITKPLAYHKPKFVKPTDDASVPPLKSSSSVPSLITKSSMGAVSTTDEIFLDDANEALKAKSPGIFVDAALPSGLKPKTPTPVAEPTTSKDASQFKPLGGKAASAAQSASYTTPLDQLQDILPRMAMPTMPLSHPHITPLCNAMSQFVETDFSFITNISSQWEATAAETRKRLDAERARRQAEEEERTSQLFQDGAIGYGDIGQMEEDNKEKELEKQEQETNAEWQSYLKDFFGVAFERLQKDIEELIRIRGCVDSLCQTGVAGQQALEAAARPDAPDRAVTLDDALNLLIRVHSLLVTREVEADKLVVERDRRYKKNITRSLYRKGQIKKMKEQEAYFERLERKANVERRRERLKNCGLLMKEVKAAVGHGCDVNEAFAAEIIAVVRKITLDDSLVRSRKAEVQTAIRRASDVLTELAQSSTALMRHYERVDSLLNDAEYEHQVAVERASEAAESVFYELEAQKKEQDRLLKVEAGQRETAVDKTLQEWRADLGKITTVLSMNELASPAGAGDSDEDKKKRLQAALEEAKRRNGDL